MNIYLTKFEQSFCGDGKLVRVFEGGKLIFFVLFHYKALNVKERQTKAPLLKLRAT